MNLQITERIVLLGILPPEGDFTTLRIIRALRESLSFTDEEHKKYKFRTEGDRILWDNDNGETKDIPIGEKATDIIVDALKKLSNEKKLRNEHFTIYEKFVGG